MGKPRPPLINQQNSYSEVNVIEGTKFRFELLEEENRKNGLPRTYIALEALSALSAGKVLGFSDDQMRGMRTESWGEEDVIVPLNFLNIIAEAWMSYQDAPTGKTMGESFHLEGGGQGKARARQLQMNRDQSMAIAHDVEIIYLEAAVNGFPVSEEKAVEQVANERNKSFDTVQKSHKRHKKYIRRKLEEVGVITSQGKNIRKSAL